MYRGTGVSRGVRPATLERSLKNWELQIPYFEEFFCGGNTLGLVPASLPHTLGYACTFYSPTFPLPIPRRGGGSKDVELFSNRFSNRISQAGLGRTTSMCPGSIFGAHPWRGQWGCRGRMGLLLVLVCNVWLEPTRASHAKAAPLTKSASLAMPGFTVAPALEGKSTDFGQFNNEHHGECKSMNSFWKGRLYANDIEHHVVWSAMLAGVDSLFSWRGGPDDLGKLAPGNQDV